MRLWRGSFLILCAILAGTPALAQSGGAIGHVPAGPSWGEAIFDQGCAGCHGAVGEGGAGPALRGNHTLANRQFVLSVMLRGLLMMPSFAGRLSNDEIAAVASYIRNSWGNHYGPITGEEVAAAKPHRKAAGQQPGPAR